MKESTILLLRQTGNPDLWILKERHDTWLIGERPECLTAYLSCSLPRFLPKKFDRERVMKAVKGTALLFLSKQIFVVGEDGGVKTVKNRYGGDDAVPPFASLPEAAVVSAANGWPEPVELDELCERF